MIKSPLNALSSLNETALKKMSTFSLAPSLPLSTLVRIAASPVPPKKRTSFMDAPFLPLFCVIPNFSPRLVIIKSFFWTQGFS